MDWGGGAPKGQRQNRRSPGAPKRPSLGSAPPHFQRNVFYVSLGQCCVQNHCWSPRDGGGCAFSSQQGNGKEGEASHRKQYVDVCGIAFGHCAESQAVDANLCGMCSSSGFVRHLGSLRQLRRDYDQISVPVSGEEHIRRNLHQIFFLEMSEPIFI